MTKRKQTTAPGLGTFAGVFTPSILTILGIILFRRVGYVVGTAGLGQALLVLGFSTLISVLTSLSLSAIATNIRVKKGGDYYLISRTLGVEFGGAIGIVLFLAQAVSIAFYCMGFAEAVVGLSHWEHPYAVQIIAAGAAALLFLPAWLGADIATRFQFVIMLILTGSLVAFFIGAGASLEPSRIGHSWHPFGEKVGFWSIFAIFFPAVTGFTQGVSMSGDLRDPARSLPLGTFAAVALSTVVYAAAIVLFAGTMPQSVLATDNEAMRRIASVPWLIDAGVISATLSSAMASFLGAPRILQSLASDKVFRILNPFAKGHGPSDNPRRGVLLSSAIALGTIAMGDLNLIAPVVSMFFLLSYGLLNYATYCEARAESPSFRPRFRWFHQRLSLAGAVVCLGAMVAVDATAAAISGAVLFSIYQYLQRTSGPARWADSRRAHHFRIVRQNLLAMEAEPHHPRDWRPFILAFSDDARRREILLRFASWIEGGTGLTTAVRLLTGDGPKIRREKDEQEIALRREIQEQGFEVFPLCLSTSDLLQGARMLLQAYGIGPLRANVILLNWLEQALGNRDEAKERRYGSYLRAALRLKRNVVVLEAEYEEWAAILDTPSDKRRIDIWWRQDASSQLLLLMAHLMTRDEVWCDASIRVISVADPKIGIDASRELLEETLEDVRIDAEAHVIESANEETVVRLSADSTLVMMPMRLKVDQPLNPFGGSIEDLVSRLPVSVLAIAGEEIDLAAEPDEGPGAELAELHDRLEEVENRAVEFEKIAQAAEKAAEKAVEALAKTESVSDELKRLQVEAERLKTEADDAAKRAIKARAVADSARRATIPETQSKNRPDSKS